MELLRVWILHSHSWNLHALHHREHSHGLHLGILRVDDLERHVWWHSSDEHSSGHSGLARFFYLLLLNEFFFFVFSAENSFFIIIVLVFELSGFVSGGVLDFFGVDASILDLIFSDIRLFVVFFDFFL
jgi:hypothetical protein